MADIILVDSYGEENYTDTSQTLGISVIANGQSFMGKAGILKNCKFYLKRQGSPAGNIYAKLYTHSGVYGTSSKPTGESLATSNPIDVSTIPTSFELITFDFEDNYELEEEVKYCIDVEWSGGDGANHIMAGIDVHEPTHAGNRFYYTNSWYYSSGDCIFYIYTEEIIPYVEPSGQVKSIAKPITLKTTKEINGAWTANIQILPDRFIACENYIDIDGEEYIVKKLKSINDNGKLYQSSDSIYLNGFE